MRGVATATAVQLSHYLKGKGHLTRGDHKSIASVGAMDTRKITAKAEAAGGGGESVDVVGRSARSSNNNWLVKFTKRTY